MTFEFDAEATIDAMAYAGLVDLEEGAITIYASICVGEEGDEHPFSHGGVAAKSAQEAIEVAQISNRIAGSRGQTCRYMPASIGVDVRQLLALADLVREGLEGPDGR